MSGAGGAPSGASKSTTSSTWMSQADPMYSILHTHRPLGRHSPLMHLQLGLRLHMSCG
jgi:hypothetical protein